MRMKLTANLVRTAKAVGKRAYFWDTTKPGLGLMVTPSGHRSFLIQYRFNGKSVRRTLDATYVTLEQARAEAAADLGQVARGLDPQAERRRHEEPIDNTLEFIAREYFRREGKRLRSMNQRQAAFERLVFQSLGRKQIDSISRLDIVRLLDRVEDERGAPMADKILQFMGRLFNWHASRSDTFRSPIVRGMTRTRPHERARQRTLSDAELKKIWHAAQAQPGAFPALVRFLLLTAVRRNEAARMKWEDVRGAEWLIPAASNKSKKDLLLPLSKDALAVLRGLPRIGDYVFTTNGKAPISGFNQFKRRFDSACGVTGWRLHDCRRTARSLMSRAGVNADIAERCLGHAIAGIRGTYDKHHYIPEMRAAFETLAAQIDAVLRG
jgi:integrase